VKKKAIALSTLLIAITIGVVNQSLHAYRRHHGGRHHSRRGGFGVSFGHRGHHRYRGRGGFGVSFGGHGGHHYRRPWYRRPWGGWGYPTDSISKYSWKDSRGNMYWRVRNKSNVVIIVTSDKQQISLQPGQTRRLYRDGSFVFKAKHDAGPVREFETNNHYVILYTGRDTFRPWRTRIKMRSVVDWGGY